MLMWYVDSLKKIAVCLGQLWRIAFETQKPEVVSKCTSFLNQLYQRVSAELRVRAAITVYLELLALKWRLVD